MTPKRRFIASILKSAEEFDTALPFQRGAPRNAAIARRKLAAAPAPRDRKSA
ncbi:hypothetical protein LR948_07680 [Roseivivax sp. GX 12232]|uniref:hypothetical protein n=1 Tax=Roseivivax sp. GX 12232 TaxID=2900547 RepID=UPI001E44242A|nr:hypothetical protein [Roseivivax sp. GX 12232]MCE0505228.1 hypothetical protein [Roseivivax sp. GX 12232]